MGTYIDKEVLSNLDKELLNDKESIQKILCNPTTTPRTIRLVAYWTIPSAVLTKGIFDYIQPRIEGKKTSEEMAEIKTKLYEIMPKGDVASGTEVLMTIDDDLYTLIDDVDNIDGDNLKQIKDKDFCEALCDVYFGDKAVSAGHKESVIKRLSQIIE